MMAVLFFIAHEKGFKFHARPQTGAHSCSYHQGKFITWIELHDIIMMWFYWNQIQ